MSAVIFQSLVFWIYLTAIIIFVCYQYFFTDKYHWVEAIAQVSISFVVVWVFSLILYTSTNDVADHEIWTDKAVALRYYEQWDERVSCRHPIYCTRRVSHYHSGSKGRPGYTTYSTERYVCGHHHAYDVDHHQAYWVGVDAGGSQYSMWEVKWKEASRKWGNTFVRLNRARQHSSGDGNMYTVTPVEYIPVSSRHEYDNWVKGSQITIMRRRSINDSLKLPYPEITSGFWNNPKLQRVLEYKHTKLPDWQTRRLEFMMDSISARVSKAFQVNPILILTDASTPKKLIAEISQSWLGAKKNDSVLLLGVSGTKIMWAETISWTHSASYIGSLKRLVGKDLMSTPKLWGNYIQTQWKRWPMAEFNYLKYEIEIEWYWQLVIGILAFSVNLGLWYVFANNTVGRDDEL